MGFIGLVADAATTIQQETGEITRFFSIAHVKQLLNDLGNWSVSLIGKIVIAVLIWFIGKKIIRVLDKLVKKILDRSTLDKGVVNFVVSVLKFVMYAILIMIVVDKLGFQTTSLLTLFGSAALAIGMSLQGSLSNFAGGILILIFKPFKVGDYIIVGTNEGTVKSIEILYTRLVTIDNKVYLEYEDDDGTLHYFLSEKKTLDSNGNEVIQNEDNTYYDEDGLELKIKKYERE